MYIIVKKVGEFKYYWNKKKFEWVGILDNAFCFETKLCATKYFQVYKMKIFIDATIEEIKTDKKVDFKFRK